MKPLLKNEIKKTFKRTDARVLLLLGLWPMLLSILVVMKPDVFKMDGSALGAFEFANYMVIIQNDIFLPLLVTVLIASMSLYQEITKKTIYFYKDIPRKNILNAKYLSIYGVYFVFLVLYLLMSYVAYYIAFIHQDMATGTFIAYPDEMVDIIYTVIQIVLGATLYIHVGILLAVQFSTGMSMFGVTLFYMFAKIIPNFRMLKFIFPIGYKNVIELTSHPYLFSMALSLLVYAIYHFGLYTYNKKIFQKIQFH